MLQKSGRLVLWEAMFILELHSAETQVLYSMVSLLVRLGFVFFLIPVYGIYGYLWGLLVSQLVQTVLCMIGVRKIR